MRQNQENIRLQATGRSCPLAKCANQQEDVMHRFDTVQNGGTPCANQKKYNLSEEIRCAVEDHVFTMALSDPHLPFAAENFEDFATSIHSLVCRTRDLGKTAAEYQSMRLRVVLTAKGIPVPKSGDFVYWGGRCFPTPTMFLPAAKRKAEATNMAQTIVQKIGTEKDCPEAVAANILAASAVLDEEMLTMRTAALVDLLNKSYPSYKISEYIGNFTILPDGSLLSLHYLYTA